MTNYTTKVEKLNTLSIVKQKLSDYGVLMKFRLSLTVVFSAAMAYLIAQEEPTNWVKLAVLVFGGFFVTGAASALNQVLEKDYDRMMKRTEKRPVAAGRMTTSEAVLVAGLLSLVGVSLLCLFNAMTAFLGMVSLILYAFVYTPLKRVSNIAVIVGAFPGAFPMLIGCTAAQGGTLTWLGLTLFAIQFLWQLPHFWAIAWLAHEDYEKAGFQLLPTNHNERNSQVGMQSMLYALFLLPLSWLPYGIGATGWLSAVFLTVAALAFAWFGWQLHKRCDRISARKLMFASLLYLPSVLIALLVDKI